MTSSSNPYEAVQRKGPGGLAIHLTPGGLPHQVHARYVADEGLVKLVERPTVCERRWRFVSSQRRESEGGLPSVGADSDRSVPD